MRTNPLHRFWVSKIFQKPQIIMDLSSHSYHSKKAEIGRRHMQESAATRNRILAISQSFKDVQKHKFCVQATKVVMPPLFDKEADLEEKQKKVGGFFSVDQTFARLSEVFHVLKISWRLLGIKNERRTEAGSRSLESIFSSNACRGTNASSRRKSRNP
eukprot:TRINITY_DN399_c0_g1_i13.p1 TRINITY_DN399_c0_g1~~TRINITY_DN399_c0_g1_i13.p1  ORF type:complete len:158 (-),score=15.14 TRINITY_DN399_c0_g1_i13:197-670(-)